MAAFDEELGRRLEKLYSTPSVSARRQAILDALGLQPGQSGLDIGTGPGFLACDLAERVGKTGRVAAIDLSPTMIEFARQRSAKLGVAEWTDFQEANATELPFPDASFDGVIAVQVFEYVPDLERALAEVRRVLRPGGRLVAMDTDWATLAYNTEFPSLLPRIAPAMRGHLHDPSLPRTLVPRLRAAGFANVEAISVPMLETRLDPDTYGATLLEILAGVVREHNIFTPAEADALFADIRRQAENDAFWFSLSQYRFVANVPA